MQRVVQQKSCTLELLMHTARNELLHTAGGAEIRQMPSFGTIEQPLEPAALELRSAQSAKHQSRLDRKIYTELVCMTAEDTLDRFTETLRRTLKSLPGFSVVQMQSEEELMFEDPTVVYLLVGPVKKPERVAVKVGEYESERKVAWPFIRKVRDSE